MDAESREFHALVARRDLYAAGFLLQRHRERLFERLRHRHGRVLGDVEVELVVDEALRRARDWAFGFDPARGALGRWLERIAENCARDTRTARRRFQGAESLDQLPAREAPDERLDELRGALAGLGREERLILSARYRPRAFPDTRLGHWLGCTRGHVQNRRCAILKRLRRRLEDRDA